ncbi:MAG: 3-isopropylmalate dehydratase large subunit, partial [Pseudomonadota bacterium]
MTSTLFDKIWDAHLVTPESRAHPATLYIDLHLIHEVTSPQAFTVLRERGLPVRRPDRTLATIDHSTPTLKDEDGKPLYVSEQSEAQVATLLANAAEAGIETHGWDSDARGVVHVMGPELGAVQPGMTIVCGDSHTSTHGAFGAIAFGIGTTQVGHVLATQCLLMRRPKTMAIELTGDLAPGVTPKDVILAIIAEIGVGGGTGYALEYRGRVFEEMSMEGRMTVCNMSIEAGARCGLIAPDETTFDYLRGRPHAPEDYDAAVERWRQLKTDDGAAFDKVVTMDASAIRPMATYGTHPGHAAPVDAMIPQVSGEADEKALTYMKVRSGERLSAQSVDRVFVGSCTNGRLEDMRATASVLSGRVVAPHVRMIVVPGSESVKTAAEAEGLDKVIRLAGAEWREPGCSM